MFFYDEVLRESKKILVFGRGSAIYGGSGGCPRRTGKHHPVMHNAEDVHDTVVRYPINDQVTRGTNTPGRLDMLTGEARGEYTNTR